MGAPGSMLPPCPHAKQIVDGLALPCANPWCGEKSGAFLVVPSVDPETDAYSERRLERQMVVSGRRISWSWV